MKLIRGVNREALRGLACLVIALVAVFFSSSLASAAASGASGLSISPLREDITLVPTETQTFQVTLKNITGAAIIAKPIVRDFISDNVDGNPKIVTNPNYNDPASIKKFFPSLSSVPLAEGQQLTFTVSLKAPDNVTPGAYYGLIEYQAVTPPSSSGANTNNKVALTAAVSQLVFITVPGNVTEKMQINSLQVYRDTKGTSAGLFFTSPPKSAGVDLANLGDAFEQPYGTVTIQNFSGKTIDTYQVNNTNIRGIVLPYSDRTFVNAIKGISTPGPYTVSASITYGSGGSAILLAKKTFWYIPSWIIVIIILIILLLAFWVWTAWKRYKKAGSSHRYRG